MQRRRAHTHARTHMSEHRKSQTHTRTLTYTNTYKHSHTHTYTYALTHTHANHTDTHLHTHTRIHTCTHTHIKISIMCTYAHLTHKMHSHTIKHIHAQYHNSHAQELVFHYFVEIYAGMDQRKTSLPYDSVEQTSAADTASNRITQAVMGGIIHGIGKYIYVSDGLLLDLKGGDFGECI